MAIKYAADALCGLAVLIVAALAGAAPSQAETYRNTEYGFSVAIPDGLHTCRSMSWVHEHVIGILLDAAGDCDRKAKAAMNVIGNYNTNYDDLAAIHDAFCQPRNKTERVVEVAGLSRLAGLPSVGCRTDSDDGGVDIEVFAMVGNPDDGIYYTAGLTTTKDRRDGDLVAFRHFLQTVRVFKPEPCENPSPFGCVPPGTFSNPEPSR